MCSCRGLKFGLHLSCIIPESCRLCEECSVANINASFILVVFKIMVPSLRNLDLRDLMMSNLFFSAPCAN